jgi:ATP-dependent exoDNAse (exonuclease V) beta subunit
LKKREEAIPEPHGEEEYQRAQHLLTALSWSLAHRDRMGLAVWVEQSWRRLGADLALNDAERSEARRFLDLLAEAESAGAGLDLSRINQHLNTLYAEQAAEHSSVEIMTLHKAKGLQFDHVFMPMMHKTIGGQGRDLLRWHWLSSGSVDGLLIAANDRRSPEEPSLYNYLNWLQRKKDAAELRRLVYVGVTRARSSVCISGGHNPTQDWPHWPSSGTGLGVLREAVSEEVIFHPDDVKHPMVPEQESTKEGVCRLPLEALPLERVPEPTIVSQGRTPAGDPESVTPGGRQIDKSVLYREGNRVDRAVGTSTHRALELLSHRSMLPEELDQPLLAAIELSLRSSGLEGTTLLDAQEKVNALIRRTLKDERGRWILKKRPCADSELVLNRMAAEGMESRVVDRTFVDDDTGIRWVVDYKTSQPMAGESMEQFLKRELTHYRDQVMHYVELLAQWDKSAVEVRGGLYFPAHSIWQSLT